MAYRFTKMDIGSMRPKNPGRTVKKTRTKLLVPPVLVAPAKSGNFSLRKVASFALAGLALVTALQGLGYASSANQAKGEILGVATSAYGELNDASKNLAVSDFASAQSLFVSAQDNLSTALNRLNEFKALKWLVPQANSADHLLSGASKLAAAGEKMSLALAIFDELRVTSNGIETTDFNQKIKANRELLFETMNLVSQASDEFDQVSSVPADYSQTLVAAKKQVSMLAAILKKLVSLEDLYLDIFGDQKTYLMVFQNYDEARPTGGFIGTYGVLKVRQGKIDQLKIESVYNLDGRITAQVAAPGPFQPEIKKWGLRDANWFADFRLSAEKLLYFFELGSQTADGVLSFTPRMFEDLLRLTGPIEMPEYDIVLTAENFQEVVQFKTSHDYDRVLNQPKKFLSDFAPALLDRLTDMEKEEWISFMQVLENNLREKHVLLYSKDTATQRRIEELGFSGRVEDTDHDYLALISSNLGGTKTDLEIDQEVSLQSKILSDGSVINNLTIKRTNNSRQKNKSYFRVLVPLGSQLVSSAGFSLYPHRSSTAEGFMTDPELAAWDEGYQEGDLFIRTESGKTEFSGWVEVMGGEQKNLTLTYALPIKIVPEVGYSLLLQKQSGSRPYAFKGALNLGSFRPLWAGSGVSLSGNSLVFESNSSSDDFWGMVLKK